MQARGPSAGPLLLEGRCHPLPGLFQCLAAPRGDADCRRQPCIPDWRKGAGNHPLCICGGGVFIAWPQTMGLLLGKVYYPLSLAWRQIVLYNYLPSLNTCAYWSLLSLLRGGVGTISSSCWSLLHVVFDRFALSPMGNMQKPFLFSVFIGKGCTSRIKNTCWLFIHCIIIQR